MKSVTLLLAALLLAFASASLAQELEPLFNGKDLKGLQTTGNWNVKDGVLHLVPREGEKGWKRYDAYLWSEKEYEDFEAELEFKYPPKGNSGFYFRASAKDPVKDGIEVQILDSFGVKKKLGHHDMGGIIQTAGPTKNASKPAGEWNKMWVKAVGSKIRETQRRTHPRHRSRRDQEQGQAQEGLLVGSGSRPRVLGQRFPRQGPLVCLGPIPRPVPVAQSLV